MQEAAQPPQALPRNVDQLWPLTHPSDHGGGMIYGYYKCVMTAGVPWWRVEALETVLTYNNVRPRIPIAASWGQLVNAANIGQLSGDHRHHLIAFTLGGPTQPWNCCMVSAPVRELRYGGLSPCTCQHYY